MRPRLSRRSFLGGAVAVAVVGCSGGDEDDDAAGERDSTSTTRARPAVDPVDAPALPFAAVPFTLGVASGDPDATSVVLWTRLVPDPAAADGGAGADDLMVALDVAADEAFEELVSSEVVPAPASLAHSVHVEARDLDPGGTWFFRFRAGEHTSAVGRTHTMAEGAAAKQLRLAVASCQDFSDGFYAAHRHLAAEEPDLVVWLGDYIYESAGGTGGPREHEGPETRTLEQYRRRYAQYRLDPDLQAAHHSAPWAVTWDDHEVANNHAGDVSDGDEAPEAFRARRAAAYQAWYEHLPVRLPPPDGADYDVARTVAAGDLLALHLIDARQFRADQACSADGDLGSPCVEMAEEDRTMLGADQEAWLDEAVATSGAIWDVIGNQTMLAPAVLEVGPVTFVNLDQWDGYPAARRRLHETLAKAQNPVVVTGDLHASVVSDLTRDPDDPDSDLLGTELVGTSISSSFPTDLATPVEVALATRPHHHFADAGRRGYVLCTITRERFVAAYRLIDDATDPDSGIDTAATFEITAGRPGARQV